MTRKELAIQLATIVKERNHLTSSVNALAQGYLKGCGQMRAYSKEELEKAVEAVK